MIGRSIVTAYVADVARSIKFYVEVLGFKLRPGASAHWAEVDGPGVTLGLHVAGDHGPKPGAAGSLSIGFEVEQPLEDVIAVLENRGVRFDGGIVGGAVRLARFSDPDGTALYLAEAYKG